MFCKETPRRAMNRKKCHSSYNSTSLTHAQEHDCLPGALPGLTCPSPCLALLLARTVRENLGATWGLSETGAAGPTGNPYGDAAGHSSGLLEGRWQACCYKPCIRLLASKYLYQLM